MNKIACEVCKSNFVKVCNNVLCPKCDTDKYYFLVRKAYKKGCKYE